MFILAQIFELKSFSCIWNLDIKTQIENIMEISMFIFCESSYYEIIKKLSTRL